MDGRGKTETPFMAVLKSVWMTVEIFRGAGRCWASDELNEAADDSIPKRLPCSWSPIRNRVSGGLYYVMWWRFGGKRDIRRERGDATWIRFAVAVLFVCGQLDEKAVVSQCGSERTVARPGGSVLEVDEAY